MTLTNQTNKMETKKKFENCVCVIDLESDQQNLKICIETKESHTLNKHIMCNKQRFYSNKDK